MVKTIRNIVLLTAVLAFTGCASMNSIYRNHDFKKGSALLDIKQRAIVAKDIGGEKGLMICAEPSPDAMSAYAAELAGKANLPKSVEIELAGAFHESTSNVGLRTQSIQLLRDRSYRLCEARMNDFISNEQFELQMRREQRNTVALLAIEQLTGVVKVPTVTINTKGTAEIARNVDDLIAQKDVKDKEIATKKEERDAIKEDDQDAQAKKEALTEEIAELEKSRDALAESIKKDRSIVASGSATAVVNAEGLPTQRSDAHIQAIAEYVDKIVEYTQTDDLGQMCLIYMKERDIPASLTAICNNHFRKVGEQQEAFKNVMNAFGNKVTETPIKNAQDIKMLAEALKLISDIRVGGDVSGLDPEPAKAENPKKGEN